MKLLHHTTESSSNGGQVVTDQVVTDQVVTGEETSPSREARSWRIAVVVAGVIAALGSAALALIALVQDSVSLPLLIGSWLLALPVLVITITSARRTRAAAGHWSKRALAAVFACVFAVVLLTANTLYVTTSKEQTCAQRVGVGASVAGCDLAKANLRGRDLRRADLSAANLSGAVLTNANLSGANLRGANLSGARLRGATLDRARLDGAKLENAALAGLDLRQVSLRRANLAGTDLSGAQLTGTDLSGANLSKTKLDGLDLSGATLRGSILDGASMQRVVLNRADLAGARFNTVNLDWANLGGAVGFTDGQLSAALTVATDQLGRSVKEHGLQLEPEQTVLAALSPVCNGTPVAGAATVPGATYHPMGIVGMTQLAGWSPSALRFAELAACVDGDSSSVVEVCPYVSVTTGEAATVTRFQHSRHVRVVNAATGATVADQTIQGPPPGECPETTTSLSPIGTAVSDADVQTFLTPFVGSVPTIVPEPLIVGPAVTVTVTPRATMPGTTVSATARECQNAVTTFGSLLGTSGRVVATGVMTTPGSVDIIVPVTTARGTYRVQVGCVTASGPTRIGTTKLKVA